MKPWTTKRPAGYPIWLAAVLVATILLRLEAVPRYPHATGDVNLFCLAADQWAKSGQLHIGFKNHFDPRLIPFGLNEPLTQHLPLWSLTGGIIKSLFPSLDTYLILQGLSFFFGCLLPVLIYFLLRSCRTQEWIIFSALVLVACSPILIEYSVNGSFYILMACQWITLFLLLPRLSPERWSFWLLGGGLLGISVLTHFPQALLAPILLFHCSSKGKQFILKGLLACFVGFLLWLPWGWRNHVYFSDFLYSSTTLNFYQKWGLLETRLEMDHLVQVPLGFRGSLLKDMLNATPLNLWQFLKGLAWETLYLPLGLSLYGFYASWRKRFLLPAGWLPVILVFAYLVYIAAWGFIRPRFLVPMIPWIFLWGIIGLAALLDSLESSALRLPRLRMIGVALVIIVSGIMLWQARPDERREYENRERQASTLIANWLAGQPEGIVLGYSDLLDGGIEAIRFHRQPYVHGRNFLFQPQATAQLLTEYSPRYIWADSRTRPFIESIHATRLLHREGHFCILEVEYEISK